MSVFVSAIAGPAAAKGPAPNRAAGHARRLVAKVGAGEVTPEEVQHSIDLAKRYLYSQQNAEGTWDLPAPRGNIPADTGGGQWGGLTALVTYALLAAGEEADGGKLAKSVEFLKKADIVGTYALGLRCQVWNLLPEKDRVEDSAGTPGRGRKAEPGVPTYKECVLRDGKLLLKAMKTGQSEGMYDYFLSSPPTSGRYDHSISQYGVLGMWALEQAGLEVPDEYWAAVDRGWRRDQGDDGGWTYVGKADREKDTATFVAAGVATLFITGEYLHAAEAQECNGNLADPDIERGLNWMAEHFSSVFELPNRQCYALYGVERIGVASGRKFFGSTDWYQKGAEYLVHSQRPDGIWTANTLPLADTAFALLFLVRGRAPVIMNKLDYSVLTGRAAGATASSHASRDPARAAAAPVSRRDTPWNQRPRDVAHLASWLSKTIESNNPLNWQVVGLDTNVDDWHDAPILYVSGDRALKLGALDEQKLKKFVEDGGMILFNADCPKGAGSAFGGSVHALGTKLFGGEFRELPPDHPIYRNEEFHRTTWKIQPRVQGLSNGARELMILLAEGDPAKAWQAPSKLMTREKFELGADVFLYATDKENLSVKGMTYLVKANADTPSKTIRVARLEAGGEWDPEPGGWRRLAAIMHNEDSVTLQVETVKPGEGKLAGGGYQVAHLTGTARFTLSAAARSEIARFVGGGGTLIVDAAGGQPDFAASASAEVARMFKDAESQLQTPLPLDHPVYAAGPAKIDENEIAFRPYAKKKLAERSIAAAHIPLVRGVDVGGRIGVFLSNEDLSVGLVGMPVDGVVGYQPEAAADLMEHMILYADHPVKTAAQ